MNEMSINNIEIGEKEYRLFLNRRGVIAISKITQEETEKAQKVKSVIEGWQDAPKVDVTSLADPLSIVDEEEANVIAEADTLTVNIHAKMFWVMLSTEHKLTYAAAEALFKQAVEEYGLEAITELCSQIIDEVNTPKFNNENKELKKLKALKSKVN